MDEKEIVNLAKELLIKEKKYSGEELENYKLKKLEMIKGKKNQYYLLFDLPNTLDALIEIILDFDTNEIISFKNEWA